VLLTVRSAPAYQSSVTYFVSTPTESTGTPLQADQYAQRRINSYVLLLDTEEFAKDVITVSGIDRTIGQVQAAISGSADVNTVLLTATIVDTSPEASVAIAGAVATAFGPFVGSLDKSDASASAPVVLNVVSGPTLNPNPISPRPTLNVTLGLLVGLALGLGFAVLLDRLDVTIRSLDVLREVSGLPILGTIGLDTSAKTAPLLLGDALRSVRAEAFRQFRTNLQFIDVDQQVQVILLTSAVASEGKSTTVANLAIVYAETGRRVLLVEADMRRPRISDYLGLERAVGLSNVLAGQVQVEDVMQQWGADTLTVLPSGSVPPNPSELLGSHNMVDLIDVLRKRFDIILIDTPPLLPVTDAAVSSTWADGVVMVVRYGSTTRIQVGSALSSLAAVDAHVLGCVLTMRPRRGADAETSGYGGYGYYDDESEGTEARKK
jgi:capsular exopolysaccharide synthesis family protein